MRAFGLGALAAALVVAVPGAARAAKPDTTYGRIDGDLAVVGGLGATFGPRDPRATVDVRLRYLSTAGLFGTYEDGPILSSGAEPRRVLATGVELRPLFLARWLTGRELGLARLDLALDSLGFELGAAFLQPAGASFGGKPGLQAGIGLELPVLPSATGPMIALHGGVRWSDAALEGAPLHGPSDRALYLNVALAWQQIFGAHVVDLGDRDR